MTVLYYTFFIAGALVLAVMVRLFLLNRKTIPLILFMEALRNENSGDFEAAILGYETALAEEGRSRFPRGRLMSRITSKLKVLRTLISYQASFHYTNNRWAVTKS